MFGEHVACFKVGDQEDVGFAGDLGDDPFGPRRIDTDRIVECERPVDVRAGNLTPRRHYGQGGRIEGRLHL